MLKLHDKEFYKNNLFVININKKTWKNSNILITFSYPHKY